MMGIVTLRHGIRVTKYPPGRQNGPLRSRPLQRLMTAHQPHEFLWMNVVAVRSKGALLRHRALDGPLNLGMNLAMNLAMNAAASSGLWFVGKFGGFCVRFPLHVQRRH